MKLSKPKGRPPKRHFRPRFIIRQGNPRRGTPKGQYERWSLNQLYPTVTKEMIARAEAIGKFLSKRDIKKLVRAAIRRDYQ